MLKIFDINKGEIKRAHNCKKVNISISSGVLDWKYTEMYNTLKCIIAEQAIAPYMFWSFDVIDQCTKEDIEDLYNTIESILVDYYTNNVEKNEKRLGTFGLPEKINLKKVNLLRLLNFEGRVDGFNFEVGKKGGFWKKRMVK